MTPSDAFAAVAVFNAALCAIAPNFENAMLAIACMMLSIIWGGLEENP